MQPAAPSRRSASSPPLLGLGDEGERAVFLDRVDVSSFCCLQSSRLLFSCLDSWLLPTGNSSQEGLQPRSVEDCWWAGQLAAVLVECSI